MTSISSDMLEQLSMMILQDVLILRYPIPILLVALGAAKFTHYSRPVGELVQQGMRRKHGITGWHSFCP